MHQPLGESETVWWFIHTPKQKRDRQRDNNKTLLFNYTNNTKLFSLLCSPPSFHLFYVPHNTKRQHNSHLFPLKSSIFNSLSLWIDLVSEKRYRQDNAGTTPKTNGMTPEINFHLSLVSLDRSVCRSTIFSFLKHL
jgi:hypothetical protein